MTTFENFHLASTQTAQNISLLRKSRGWSRQELVDRLKERGIITHTTSIQRIEHGTQSMRFEEVLAIAAIFNISVDELVKSADPAVQADQAARTALQQARKIGKRLVGDRIELEEIMAELQEQGYKRTSTMKKTLEWLDDSIRQIFPLAERMIDGPSHEKHLDQQRPSPTTEWAAAPNHEASPEPSDPMTPYDRAVEAGAVGYGEEKLFPGEEMPVRPEHRVQREAERVWREKEKNSTPNK